MINAGYYLSAKLFDAQKVFVGDFKYAIARNRVQQRENGVQGVAGNYYVTEIETLAPLAFKREMWVEINGKRYMVDSVEEILINTVNPRSIAIKRIGLRL